MARKANPKPLSTYPEAMTVRELAEFLRVDERTVTEMLQQGALPYVKVGRQYRIPKRAVATWLEGGGLATTA